MFNNDEWEPTEPWKESNRPPTAEELEARARELNVDVLPVLTDAEHPLCLWVPKEVLIRILEANLGSVRRTRVDMDLNLQEFEHSEELVAQRREFLDWLQQVPGGFVWLGLVPRKLFFPPPQE